MVGWFLTGLPLATAIGGPLSPALLQFDGAAGLHGWQWMFIGEGVPTVLIGISVMWVLTERPSQAKWLSDAEKTWLETELAHERQAVEAVRTHSILSAMINPRVVAFAVIFAGLGMSGVSLVLFLPQTLKSLGLSNTQAGLLTSVP